MTNNSFKDGFLDYKTGLIQELSNFTSLDFSEDLSERYDGYLAFSSGEKNLIELESHNLGELSAGKVKNVPGVEGYLIEISLWKNNQDKLFTEISLEREETGWFYQQWTLDTSKVGTGENKCYYRVVHTITRNSGNNLKSIEVICPKTRLHFFITRGGAQK